MIELTHAELKPDPQQVRRSVGGIRSKADSIAEIGLLQNLVVKETPEGYVIVAGERRWHAIGLLIEQGRWEADAPIPCLVMDDSRTMWANIAENEQRKDVDPWDLGHRFCEILETGRTQMEIAGRLHISQGRVSQLVHIAQGLAPETVATLRKLPARFSIADLVRISKLRKKGERRGETVPDVEAQIDRAKVIAGARGTRKKRRRRAEGPKEKDVVFRRFLRLRDEKSGESYDENSLIRSFVDYLSGKTTSLKLRDYRIEKL